MTTSLTPSTEERATARNRRDRHGVSLAEQGLASLASSAATDKPLSEPATENMRGYPHAPRPLTTLSGPA